MPNYNTQLQSNNTDLQEVLQALQTKAAGGEQATPVISVSSNGLITATAGTKSSTHQLAFQAAKTITPSTTSQIAVSSGYYTGGNITVAAVQTQSKTVTPTSSAQNITPDNGKFLSKVTVNAIPSTYIQPTGTKTITANGTHDVKSYESVNVSVASSGGDTSMEDGLIDGTLSNYINDRVTQIRTSAFYSCSSLKTVNFPACTTIGSYAFVKCSNLTTVSFPNATTISESAFRMCSSLAAASFPACTTIGSYAFTDCKNLKTANFPACTSIYSGAFWNCSNLTTVSFPKLTIIGYDAFKGCSSLAAANFPACTTIYSSAFFKCKSLTTASFPKLTYIDDYVFNSCYNLKSLYLTGSSVCRLYNSKAFSYTPIGGYSTYAGVYGSIYVPASLLTSYKTATNWTYFSSRFVGI